MVLHVFLLLCMLFYVLILLFFREPAPAITRHGPSTANTASFCLSFSSSIKFISISLSFPILFLKFLHIFLAYPHLSQMLLSTLSLLPLFSLPYSYVYMQGLHLFLLCLQFSFPILYRARWSISSSFVSLPCTKRE